MWRKVFLAACLLAAGAPLFAQVTSDFSLSIHPAVDIPLGPALADGTPYYSVGGGASIRGEYILPFARFLYTGLGVDFDYAPLNSSQKGLTLLFAGPQAGVTFFPVPRLQLKLAAFGGMYLGFGLGAMTYNPFAGAVVDVQYLLNPSFSIGAGASIKNAFSSYGTVYQGLGIHLGASYHVGAGGGRANLMIEPSMAPVFPLFYSYYDEHPVGTVVLSNGSPSAIQDVTASFFVKEYMEQPKVFSRLPALDRRQSVTLPVQALFERSIFDVTTETKVAGEIAVTYKYLGSEVTERKPVTVTINNRNAMTWDDDRKAAAFVTATDPDVMLFAKSIASDAGRAVPPAVNANFRIAVALFQAMALQGVGYVTDPSTPYGSSLDKAAAIDYLQFPMQTLAYRAGDCDDLSILYCAMLEAAGVRTAFITVPGHIYVAFDLGMRPEDSRVTFTNPQSLIIRDNETWVPVEITLVRKGFTEAWRSGAVDWQTNSAKGAAKFMVVRDAWQEYRPVSASRVLKEPVRLPDGESAFKAYTAELNRFLGLDLKPRAAVLQDQLKTDRRNTKLMNKLGVLYARYGMLTEAKIQFEAALRIAGESASAGVLVNLGNISYLNGNFSDAVTYYNKALEKAPNAPGALRGLALSSYEAGDTKQVDDALSRLKTADPESAEKLAALGSGTTANSQARAASADKEVNSWSEE